MSNGLGEGLCGLLVTNFIFSHCDDDGDYWCGGVFERFVS